jgi:hypothetical protein
MYYSPSILGINAVEQLRKSATNAVLTIGSDRLTRADLSRVGCYNFVAARILSEVLHHELQVKNLRQVFDEIPPAALALPRIGVISLAVLGAAFEAKGIGGATPLENYVKKHAEKVTTFGTMKHRAAVEQANERKARKRRKKQRRDQAHETRVERFEAQQGTA